MAGTVMPAPKFIGLDNNANPVSGGKLYTYVAGTTTPQATYSDVNLTVANANPVVLDSAGRATVFLSGSSYKFVLKDSDDVTIWTQDNVQAVAPFSTNLDIQGVAGEAILAGQACYLSDGSGALTAGRWYLADADNAYSSSLPQVAMAPEAIDAGETGTFRLQGSVTKSNAQADFVVGDTYYVSATAGLLSLSPGTNVRVMGQADSTTTIVISPNPPNIATTPTFIDGITVTSTDAGAAAAPYLDLYRESPSPAASDQIGEIKFSGEDSAGNKQLYARVYGQIADPTSTSEDGQVRIATMKAGVETTHLVIDETGQVLPDQAGQALGSATKAFADLFLESGAVVNFDNGNTTLTHSAGKLTLSGSGAGALDIKGTVAPTANDGAALGVSGTAWADLFLASGGVVNFNAGDTTLTHSAGKLTLAGSGAGALEVKGAVLPTVSNTPALGSTSLMWADLFLGDGGVINFNNGDVTVTHSTNTLTFAGASSGYIFNGGNVGIGVAPLTPDDIYFDALELGKAGCGITANTSSLTGSEQTWILNNAYATYSGGVVWKYGNTGPAAQIGLEDDSLILRNAASGSAGGTITWTDRLRVTSGGNLAIGATAKLYLDGVAGTGDTYIEEYAANEVRLTVGGAAHSAFNATGQFVYYNPPTTASAANAYIAQTDYIRRSTSSIRYKHDIDTLDTTDALAAVMAMRPVTYRGKTDEDQRRFVGFIAEEMQEIAPLLCTYDEGGESGTPNYVTYDRVTAYLVAVVQQQQQKIAALEARIH
jgi:hypothetical protein